MLKLKPILISSLLTLVICLAILGLTLTTIQAVQADSADQPIVTSVETDVQYLSLSDAPPQRDITTQRFAPLDGD